MNNPLLSVLLQEIDPAAFPYELEAVMKEFIHDPVEAWEVFEDERSQYPVLASVIEMEISFLEREKVEMWLQAQGMRACLLALIKRAGDPVHCEELN